MNVYAGAVTMLLASPLNPNDPGGQGVDFGKSSPVGLLVLILFFVAVAFLGRSLSKHLRRVPASFDQPADGHKASVPEQDNNAHDRANMDKKEPKPKDD